MRLGIFCTAAMVAALAAGGVSAPAVAQTDENAWLKICSTDEQAKKEVCLITQELRSDAGQFLASIAIRETPGEARKAMIASIPVGMLIQPGVQLQIDGSKPDVGRYSICFPNACYAELAIDADYINRLKRGGKLQMTTINQQGRQVRFDLTLIGFTATYDGEGMNPKQLEEKQADLQRQLEDKAKEARDRLVAEQRKALEEASQ